QAYGQTECPNLITTLTPGDHLKAVDNPGILGSCGRPVHLASLVILDTEGNEAAVGQPGEIAIKSPCIMKGYNKKPEATKAAFNKDGWLMTGDMGRVDEEGYIYIVDRRKDMIISGGLNVYSVEVEEILRKHPKVQQAAVIGVPDDHWGEAVTAMIVAAEECTAEEIKEWCKDKMAKYMQPKNVHFCDSFPLTPIGKIDKVSLRAPFWQGKERAIH
ncbi:MAG: class I adenylate-forming enzyme family protein, partial [Ignavibacteriales bacterium]